jgi:hypothetical protein
MFIDTNGPKKYNIKYMNSKPPHIHTKIITKSRVLRFHLIYVYNNGTINFEK